MLGAIKSTLKTGVIGLAHKSGLLTRMLRYRASSSCGVFVLALHRVLTQDRCAQANSQPGMVIRDDVFADMLKHLKNNFHVVSMDDFLSNNVSAPACLLTIDDGWADNYHVALQLLKEHASPATIFLSTENIGSKKIFWVEHVVRAWKKPELRSQLQAVCIEAGCDVATDVELIIEFLKHMSHKSRRSLIGNLLSLGSDVEDSGDRMLTWEQVSELKNCGVTFGAHTVTHPLLPYESSEDVRFELEEAKRTIEDRVGAQVKTFAYPNGNWDARVREQVKAAGYQAAFSTARGWHENGADLYTIRRFLIANGNVTGADKRFSPEMFNFTLSR